MRKTLIITITAALLLAAVLCTAGCVSNADPIVGSWMAQDSTTAVAAVFENDGSGSYFYVSGDSLISETDTSYSESSSSDYAEMPLRWKADGNNVYSVVFASGDTGSCTLNPQNGTFVTNNDVVYEKVPSGVLGTRFSDAVIVTTHGDPEDPGSLIPAEPKERRVFGDSVSNDQDEGDPLAWTVQVSRGQEHTFWVPGLDPSYAAP